MLKGHLLNDRYRIIDTIGGGGMANVYLARDTILHRDVAIKVLRMEYANDEEFIERFRREAQSTISLSHPNIVNIYDVGEEEDIYYLVMEYVKGMTLKKYIQKYAPIPIERAVDIMQQIIAAIRHAHENDIVHRDIKPQNILVDEGGKIKVTDFGIAMALTGTTLTQTNSVLGSVHYLSPEQARGGMANKKSDIYSMGIVFFEMLTGRLPFSGESAVSIALKHLQSNTPSVKRWNPDVPQSIENVVLKATAKDPFHRYEDVREMEEDLNTALLPDRLNEERFVVPETDGEETKAIPVITDDTFKEFKNDDTIVVDKHRQEQKPKKQKKKWSVIIGAIIFLLVASGIAALFFIPKMLLPKEVEMIDVTGLPYEEAYEQLSALNLEINRETEHSDTVSEGHVIQTNPDEGTVVREGSTVTVITSLGKEKKVFDNYEGKRFEQVKRILIEELHYKDVIAIERTSEEPEGVIISHYQPMPDEEVVPEETTVLFVVSKGPPKIVLRPLKGSTEEEAIQYAEEQKLSLNIEREYSEEVPEGHVIKQEPEPYTEVEQNTDITIYISRGPEPKPPVKKIVTFTVEVDDNYFIPREHEVKIYVEDMNHELTDLFKNDTIRKDTQYTLELTISPDSSGRYKVMLDDEVVIDRQVPYEEGDQG